MLTQPPLPRARRDEEICVRACGHFEVMTTAFAQRCFTLLYEWPRAWRAHWCARIIIGGATLWTLTQHVFVAHFQLPEIIVISSSPKVQQQQSCVYVCVALLVTLLFFLSLSALPCKSGLPLRTKARSDPRRRSHKSFCVRACLDQVFLFAGA